MTSSLLRKKGWIVLFACVVEWALRGQFDSPFGLVFISSRCRSSQGYCHPRVYHFMNLSNIRNCRKLIYYCLPFNLNLNQLSEKTHNYELLLIFQLSQQYHNPHMYLSNCVRNFKSTLFDEVVQGRDRKTCEESLFGNAGKMKGSQNQFKLSDRVPKKHVISIFFEDL